MYYDINLALIGHALVATIVLEFQRQVIAVALRTKFQHLVAAVLDVAARRAVVLIHASRRPRY